MMSSSGSRLQMPGPYSRITPATGRTTTRYQIPIRRRLPPSGGRSSTCKQMYHEWAYGPAKLTWPELTIPHTASAAIALLDAGHALLRADLLGLSEDDLNLPRRTNWGEVWPARIFT